jgi:hypothetical protein
LTVGLLAGQQALHDHAGENKLFRFHAAHSDHPCSNEVWLDAALPFSANLDCLQPAARQLLSARESARRGHGSLHYACKKSW